MNSIWKALVTSNDEGKSHSNEAQSSTARLSLSSSSVQSLLVFSARTVCERTAIGTRQSVEPDQNANGNEGEDERNRSHTRLVFRHGPRVCSSRWLGLGDYFRQRVSSTSCTYSSQQSEWRFAMDKIDHRIRCDFQVMDDFTNIYPPASWNQIEETYVHLHHRIFRTSFVRSSGKAKWKHWQKLWRSIKFVPCSSAWRAMFDELSV